MKTLYEMHRERTEAMENADASREAREDETADYWIERVKSIDLQIKATVATYDRLQEGD